MTTRRLLQWVAAAEPDVVLVCDHLDPVRAAEAVALLRAHGVDAHAMDGGVVEWRAGKEVELGTA